MNMQRTPLPELEAFCAVARWRSFRRAAVELGVSASALSHSMNKLESTLGVRLLARTTRSVAPTDAGERLLSHLAPAFLDIRSALEHVQAAGTSLKGRLRLNGPRSLSQHLLSPLVNRLLQRHPDLQVTLVSDDALIDIVAEGFDAGFRFGETLHHDMVAVRLASEIRFLVVASPAYLARHGTPATPRDLLTHRCIGLRFPSGKVFQWEFQEQGRPLGIAVDGPLLLDHTHLAVNSAREGLGLAYVYEQDARHHLEQGDLVCVLANWMPPAQPLYLYHPSRRHITPALLALIDLAREPATTQALAHPTYTP